MVSYLTYMHLDFSRCFFCALKTVKSPLYSKVN
nr:MAG TPA: hypothetical protein [Siphoviridae sp. ctWYg3]